MILLPPYDIVMKTFRKNFNCKKIVFISVGKLHHVSSFEYCLNYVTITRMGELGIGQMIH